MSGPFPQSIPPFPGLRFLSSAQLTGLATPKSLPAAPAGTTQAALSIEAGNVRWGTVAVPPTATIGTPLYGTTGAVLLAMSMFSTIQFINMTGSTSIINIDWYA